MEDKLEIQFSKKKQMGFLFGGIVLVLIGLLYFVNIQLPFLNLGEVFSIVFIIVGAVLFFSVFFLMKDQRGPAMVFNKEGLVYNPKNNRFIAWTDIASLTDYSMNGSRSVRVHVKNADAFIEKQENNKIKKAMRVAMKINDAPIVLNAHFLELSTSELLEKLHNYLMKYGN